MHCEYIYNIIIYNVMLQQSVCCNVHQVDGVLVEEREAQSELE